MHLCKPAVCKRLAPSSCFSEIDVALRAVQRKLIGGELIGNVIETSRVRTQARIAHSVGNRWGTPWAILIDLIVGELDVKVGVLDVHWQAPHPVSRMAASSHACNFLNMTFSSCVKSRFVGECRK